MQWMLRHWTPEDQGPQLVGRRPQIPIFPALAYLCYPGPDPR